MMKEANIIINGVILTPAQSRMLRIANEYFLAHLSYKIDDSEEIKKEKKFHLETSQEIHKYINRE